MDISEYIGRSEMVTLGRIDAERDNTNRHTVGETLSNTSGVTALRILAAHISELRQVDVIDDNAFHLFASAIDVAQTAATQECSPDAVDLALIVEQVEAALPASVSGLVTLGLAFEEWRASVSRVLWRSTALCIASATAQMLERWFALAQVHTVTVMPAVNGGRIVQPTTLAHYLGGVLTSIAAQQERLREAFARLNRCPLGAGQLAGSALAVDRDSLATKLGFAAPVANTFAAVSNLEDELAIVEISGSLLAISARMLREFLIWNRTDPASFLIDDSWQVLSEPSQPGLQIPARLELLVASLEGAARSLDSIRWEMRTAPYGPLGARSHRLLAAAHDVRVLVVSLLEEVTSFVTEGLIVNRAWLGNRAGRGLVTGGDLALFLITEEEIAPAPALEITSLVLSKLRDANLEIGGITQDMIDAAALMTIGREVKVEMETLGRYMAPRRYLERREVVGSAAPSMTRAWLEELGNQIRHETAWLDSTEQSIATALANLDRLVASAAAESPDD